MLFTNIEIVTKDHLAPQDVYTLSNVKKQLKAALISGVKRD